MALHTVLLIMAGLWFVGAVGVCSYADSKGLPWFPVFLSALALGFALPLLLVALTPARAPAGWLARSWTDWDV